MKLYYVDAGADEISVSTLDGSKKQVLIHTNLDQPHDIKVDPESGYFIAAENLHLFSKYFLFFKVDVLV
jgi:hypothetical protein